MQMRPKAILCALLGKYRHVRHGMRCYTHMARRAWFHEIAEFIPGKRKRAVIPIAAGGAGGGASNK